MKKHDYIKYLAAGVFFLMMLADGQLTRFGKMDPRQLYRQCPSFADRPFVWCKVFAEKLLITTALVIGCLYDVYYVGVIGIYTVAFPLIVWIMYILKNTLYQNVFTMFFGMIIFVTSLEVVTLGVQLLFKIASVSTSFFVSRFFSTNAFIEHHFVYPFSRSIHEAIQRRIASFFLPLTV